MTSIENGDDGEAARQEALSDSSFDDHPNLEHLPFFPRAAAWPVVVALVFWGAMTWVCIHEPIAMLGMVFGSAVLAYFFSLRNARNITAVRARYIEARWHELGLLSQRAHEAGIPVPDHWRSVFKAVDAQPTIDVKRIEKMRRDHASDVAKAKSSNDDLPEPNEALAFLQREFFDNIDLTPSVPLTSSIFALFTFGFVGLGGTLLFTTNTVSVFGDSFVARGLIALVAITLLAVIGLWFTGSATRLMAVTEIPPRGAKSWWRMLRRLTIRLTPWRRADDRFDLLGRLPKKDRNDIEILELRAALQRDAERVQNFTVESSLFAGISLASFLAVMSSDEYQTQIQPTADALSRIDAPVNVDDSGFSVNWSSFSDTVGVLFGNVVESFSGAPQLLLPLSILLLLSSILFICILLLRLPFALALGKAIQQLEAALRIDEKEEAAWEHKAWNDYKLKGIPQPNKNHWALLNSNYYNRYRLYIRRVLAQSYLAKNRIANFRGLMDVLRMCGFVVVALSLVVAAWFFNPTVALLVAVFFLAFVVMATSRALLNLGESFDDAWTEQMLREGFDVESLRLGRLERELQQSERAARDAPRPGDNS